MPSRFFAKFRALTAIFLLLQLLQYGANAQMRKVYLDSDEDLEMQGASFYTAAEGYIAFNRWIGYTADTGKTYEKKFITLSNVDYNGYGNVNLTFGFGVYGVKAFDKNTLIVYGDYGLVPAILYSSNGGNNFKLVYHSQYNPLQLSTGVTDMDFPGNGNTGFAVDADRVLRTTDKGLTWSVANTWAGAYFTEVQAIDANTCFVISNDGGNRIGKIQNGNSWGSITLPSLTQRRVLSASFISSTTGWVNLTDDKGKGYLFKTINGGSSWTQVNDVATTPFGAYRLKFTDNNMGYALSGQNTVWKTQDGGAIWERLTRDNEFTYLGYSHNKLDLYSASQFWTGGRHGFVEMTNNGGGVPHPKAYFKIDTTGLGVTGNVKLVNFSRKDYSYRWLLNGQELGTTYHWTYPRDPDRVKDTIQLIVSNGAHFDTATQYQQFNPPLIISSFTPVLAGKGTTVTLTGTNLGQVYAVQFGGVAATDVKVISATQVTAKVGDGATGDIVVVGTNGYGKRGGFTFVPPPKVNGFSPQSAIAGATVTITGTAFDYLTGVSFAGVPATYYQQVSPGVIEAVVPSGGDGAVSVRTLGGTDSLKGFLALPVVKNFSPLKGTEGTIMTITGTSFTGAAGVTVGGVAVLSFEVSSSTSIKALVGPGNSGEVKVTKAGGPSALPGFTWFAKPVITSFAPVSGPVGTIVTITGSGFDPAPGNNTVRFGGVLATVTGGSPTSLTVKVPAGAAFEPISVMSNRLVAYSELSFAVTFSGGSITANSFGPSSVGYAVAYPGSILHQVDLNNDGKADIINSGSNSSLHFFKNTTVGTAISYQGIYTQTKIGGGYLALNDLDGDGRVDILVNAEDSVVVIRNISPANDLAFEKVSIFQKSVFDITTLSDVDGDGKMDIVAGNSRGYIDVYRNISEGGVLAFDKPISFSKWGYSNVTIEDVDGDGKPDLLHHDMDVDGNRYYSPNTSRKGIVSFGAFTAVPFKQYAGMRRADIDGDGKLDLISSDPSTIYIYRNTGGGWGSYAAPVKLDATTIVSGFSLSDMDGDGKVDILFAKYGNAMRLMKNTSSPGAVAFAPPIDHDNSKLLYGLVATDANNDGKPDVVGAAKDNSGILVYTNQVKPEPFVESFSPTNGVYGSVVTIKGANFENVTAVYVGTASATAFTVHSSTLITATVGNGLSGNVTVISTIGKGEKPWFVNGIPPVITGLSPAIAAAGASITIHGQNFSPDPNKNLVLFGGLKAVVTSATTNALVVTVPQSAGHRRVTVTVNQMTASSPGFFSLSWPGATDNFSAASFSLPVKLKTFGSTAYDWNGDGKLDMFNGTALSRNTSTPGNISFAAPDTINKSGGYGDFEIADMDADGLPDLVTALDGTNNIYIMHNMSAGSNFQFQLEGMYPVGYYPKSFISTVVDIDGDGKPDVVAGVESSNNIHCILRNLSYPGRTLLAPRVDYQFEAGSNPYFADLDGDGKPEMIRVAYKKASVYQVLVARNNSVPGTISFENEVSVADVVDRRGMVFADMNGDGKTEIILANGKTVDVLVNGSSTGVFAFQKESHTLDQAVTFLAISDLDGDGKPDINLFGSDFFNKSYLVFLKNSSSSTSSSFKTPFSYAPVQYWPSGTHADIDGDGRPDLILPGSGENLFLRNTIGLNESRVVCANSNTSLQSDVTGTTYQWQMNGGDGFVNLPENSSWKGVTTANLQLVNISDSWLYYELRCVVDGNRYSKITKLDILPTIKPSAFIMPNAPGKICEGTSITFTATTSGGGTSPVFQWLKNNQPVGTNSDTYTATDLRNDDMIAVQLTSSAACPTAATVNSSNTVKVQATPTTATVAITGRTVVNKGDLVAVNATYTNAGYSPQLEWQDSTDNFGWKRLDKLSASIFYTPTVQGAKLRCKFTSSEPCIPGQRIFYSNALTFTVNEVTAVEPEPAANLGIHFFPNPVTTGLRIEGLQLADKWESLSITGVEGMQKKEIKNIAGKTTLTIDVSSLARGYYVVVLHRKQGPAAYLKFMKL